MKVENMIDAIDLYDHLNHGKFVTGAKRLYVRNCDAYDHVELDIVEYSGDKWESRGMIQVRARDIKKAVENSINN